jgi:hypothetical protein
MERGFMIKRRHKDDTRTFAELSFSEQSKSISAQILRLQASITAHIRRASEENRDINRTRLVCIGQINRLITRLTGA